MQQEDVSALKLPVVAGLSLRTSCALYETSKYVAKRLYTGLLTRDTQQSVHSQVHRLLFFLLMKYFFFAFRHIWHIRYSCCPFLGTPPLALYRYKIRRETLEKKYVEVHDEGICYREWIHGLCD